MSADAQGGGPLPWLRRRRKWVAAAIAAVLAYTLAGFLLVPWVISSQIRSRVRTLLDREATVEEVRFNPFTLTAEIKGLKLLDRDGADLVALDLLRANVQVLGLLRRAIRFREIIVEHPVVSARILADGKPSIADLMEQKPASGAPEEPSRPRRLIIDRLAVTQGAVDFSDASLQPPYQRRFEPLNLEIKDLITIPDEGGEHSIVIGVGDGAELRWAGRQVVEPLSFTGRLDITGMRLKRAWEYLGHGQKLAITDGQLDFSLPYEIRKGADQSFQATLNGASAAIRSLSVGSREEEAAWLEVPELRVLNVKAEWPAARAEIGAVKIVKPRALARLEADGNLNWSRVAPATKAPQAPSEPATPWSVSIAAVELEGGSVRLEDLTVEPDLALDVSDLAVSAQGVTSDLAAAIPFRAKCRLMEKGSFEATGTIAPAPLAADVKLAASGIDLTPLRSWITPVPGLQITSGAAALQGQVALAGEPVQVVMTADGAVEGVEVQDPRGERLVAWQKLGIAGLRFEDPPGRARIRKLTLDRAFAKILIDREGNLNLTTVASAAAPGGGQPGPAGGPPDTAGPAKPLAVEIGEVEFRDGAAEFSDLSLLLPFRAEIHSAKGTVRDLSTFAAAPAGVDIEGRVDATGSVKVGGTLRLSDPLASSEVRVDFRSIDMLGLTPYFAQFAGYAVQSGALDLDVRYVVKDRRLVGDHKLIAKDLVLGDKVESPDAPGLPVRLAIALLKDKDGRINLEVPIEGTVDSPEFAYRKVFWSAIKTILGNIAAAPFRAIGRLFGRDEEDLELVEFDPGRSDLLPAEQDKLAKLAEHLGPRPELTLAVEGRFDPVADPEAMRIAKLEALIAARRDAASAAATASGGSTLETILEALFVEQFSAEALQAERQRFTPAPAAEAPTPPFDAAGFYEALRAKLMAAQQISQPELAALAAARAASIMAALTGSGAVESVRVTASDPVPVKRKKAGSARVASEMTMSAPESRKVSRDGTP